MKITFLGGGNMAIALVGGLIQRGFAPHDLSVIEILPEARERLIAQFAINVFTEASADALQCDVLVLAVKPQQMRAALASLPAGENAPLIVSIAAGLLVDDLARWMGGYRRIVRAMPNTPALIGAGMTGLYADPSVSGEDRKRAEAILGAVGETVWVENEALIDSVTAISGSGPAYVFLFLEAMQEAARELGLSDDTARTLAIQTVLGSAQLAEQSKDPVSLLRERVTSKGGTTEAALKKKAELGVKEGLIAGMHAAAERSRELGVELGRD
ncbi:MAG: pyrroline-5-carboxylate reductase [Fluviibacter sp.]